MPSIVLADLIDVRESQIAQRGPGRFEARVVPRAGFDLQALTAQILANVDTYYGPGQDVSIRIVDAVPRTATGKLRSAVIDPDDVVPTSMS
jgi:phenylacetate-CoA ligase